MSEEKTKDIGEKYTTQPTIETVIQMLGEFRAAVERRFDAVDARLERMEIRLDRVESMALEARADLREMKSVLREHFPALK